MKKHPKNHKSFDPLNSDIFAFGESGPQDPSKSELKNQSEISEQDIFVGTDDFYKTLSTDTNKNSNRENRRQEDTMDRRLLVIQKVLIAGIVTICSILIYGFIRYAWITYQISNTPPTQSKIIPQLAPAGQQNTLQQVAPVETLAKAAQTPELTLPSDQPLSLMTAQLLYQQKDYKKAHAVFAQLHKNLLPTKNNQVLRDYFQLMQAMCLENLDQIDEAIRIYSEAIHSHSPIVRLVSSYQSSLLQLHKEQFLRARTHAFQTLSLIKVADFNKNWAASLKKDSHFIAAESTTKKVLSLSDSDKNIPKDLWIQTTIKHPFDNLSEAELRLILDCGSAQLATASLTPQIKKLENESKNQPVQQNLTFDTVITSQWSVICNGASIEELLSRFASNSDLDIVWQTNENQASGQEKPVWCSRPVTLYLPAVSTRQLVNIVTGSVGLIGYIQNNEQGRQIVVTNPAQYSSLKDHISLISDHSLSLWQEYLRTFHIDQRLPNARFSIGLLQAQKHNTPKAIAEYKFIANRFSDSALAPFALLKSSSLKSNMQDYTGARKDLTQLIEQYDKSEIYIQAYLNLAEATMKDELYSEAAQLYKKVFRSTSISDFQNSAAFGAARCFYEIEDYSNTIEWLNKYINSTKDQENRNYHFACYLMGKSHMAKGDPKAAYEAFQGALGKQLSKEEYGETIVALIQAKKQQEDFIDALKIIDNIQTWQVVQKDYVEIMLLKSNTLRSMGLTEKAVALLGDKGKYITSPELRAKISLELTQCYINQGKNEQAYENLIGILSYVEPGILANQTLYMLAQTCLRLDKNTETISFCRQLLDCQPLPQLRNKALSLLSTAYRRQKNYDKATMFLLGQNESIDFIEKEITSEAYSIVTPPSQEMR